MCRGRVSDKAGVISKNQQYCSLLKYLAANPLTSMKCFGSPTKEIGHLGWYDM